MRKRILVEILENEDLGTGWNEIDHGNGCSAMDIHNHPCPVRSLRVASGIQDTSPIRRPEKGRNRLLNQGMHRACCYVEQAHLLKEGRSDKGRGGNGQQGLSRGPFEGHPSWNKRDGFRLTAIAGSDHQRRVFLACYRIAISEPFPIKRP